MNPKSRLLVAASLFLGLALPSTAWAGKPVHLFIFSGQSNMAAMNPETDFMPEARKLWPDAEVVCMKVADRGQPIRFWVSEWDQIVKKHSMTVPFDPKNKRKNFYPPILAQYKELLEKHPKPASVTFCWMQGERDAKENLSAGYADALRQLIANLRRDLQQPAMNVVIGRISDFATDASWTALRAAQIAVANADPHGAWLDCDDLNDFDTNGVKTNSLHYTKEGYALLGRRYARQAKALIDGKKPAANGRPD